MWHGSSNPVWATCRQLPCPVVPIDGHHALSHRSHTHIPHHSRDLHLERRISPSGCLGAYIGSNHLHPGNAANALRGVGRPHATRHWQQPCTSDSSAKVRSVLYFGSGPTMQRFLYCTPYEVSCLLGLVLPTASRVVKTGIEKCLCISIASKVSLGWMRYASGTTLSKKTLSILGSMVSDGLCRRHSAARACWRRDCVSPGSGTSVLAVSASMSSPASSKSGSGSC